MPRYDRGGFVLKTGKIGRMNVLRQQILLPGEVLKPVDRWPYPSNGAPGT